MARRRKLPNRAWPDCKCPCGKKHRTVDEALRCVRANREKTRINSWGSWACYIGYFSCHHRGCWDYAPCTTPCLHPKCHDRCLKSPGECRHQYEKAPTGETQPPGPSAESETARQAVQQTSTVAQPCAECGSGHLECECCGAMFCPKTTADFGDPASEDYNQWCFECCLK